RGGRGGGGRGGGGGDVRPARGEAVGGGGARANARRIGGRAPAGVAVMERRRLDPAPGGGGGGGDGGDVDVHDRGHAGVDRPRAQPPGRARRLDERLVARPVEDLHPPHVAGEMAVGDEVGQRELGQRRQVLLARRAGGAQ